MSIYDLVIESKFYNNDKIADFERDCEGLRVGVLVYYFSSLFIISKRIFLQKYISLYTMFSILFKIVYLFFSSYIFLNLGILEGIYFLVLNGQFTYFLFSNFKNYI